MADLPHRIIFQPRHASICLKMVSQAYRHRSVADLPRRQRTHATQHLDDAGAL